VALIREARMLRKIAAKIPNSFDPSLGNVFALTVDRLF
jgi:hypothetical protein